MGRSSSAVSRKARSAGVTAQSIWVIYTAHAGNVTIAVIKFTAAAFSGNYAMLSEGVLSLVDSVNGLVPFYGQQKLSQYQVGVRATRNNVATKFLPSESSSSRDLKMPSSTATAGPRSVRY